MCALLILWPNHCPAALYLPAPMITVTRCAVPLIQELLPSTSTAPAGGLGTTNEEIAVPGGRSSSSTETPSAGFMIRRDDSRRLMSAFSISIAKLNAQTTKWKNVLLTWLYDLVLVTLC